MKKVLDSSLKAGSQENKEPRLLGSIVEEMLHSNSPLAKGYRQYIASLEAGKAEVQGWHVDTNLGCDVKTVLRSDRRMEAGKEYQGIFRLDAEAVTDEFLCRDAHFTFFEAALPPSSQRRNVRLFEGRHITCTVRTDGKLRLNFKGLKPESLRNVDSFALEVANEIQSALRGLVEEV